MLILTSFPQTENYLELELALDRFIEVYVMRIIHVRIACTV